MIVVDAANVVGSRPNGWWRDRAAAARRLGETLVAATLDGRLPAPVLLVLEGGARPGVAAGVVGALRVVHAPGSGDDTIVAEAARERAAGQEVTVVTADRQLRERVRQVGAHVVGPGWLWDRLDGG